MKPFLTVAIPHKDVLEGRLTLDVFAADLWEVFKGTAPDEYQDPDVFFRKTYLTTGLENLLAIAEKRVKGHGGDPIIQLQTPFGGGKTHSLIALFHKAKDWGANTVVIDGTVLDPKDVPVWEEMERQLTGDVKKLRGQTSPGRGKLKLLLEAHQPLLILIDELLQYTTKASGIRVGDSTLASQVLAFIQELTGAMKTLDKSLLMIALPSSVLEHYDEGAERLFQQIQKITGRMEKIYTPVRDEEISQVIRRRLFSSVNEAEAQEIVAEFLEYAEKEKMLPEGVEPPIYRENFLKSYPFLPEVVDVLYKRWGSFPTFQRTRGVLRLLALVTYSLRNSQAPYIRLADFDLDNEEIKRELINHIGQEFSGIIAQDITSPDAGVKKVDKGLGDAHSAFSFGTKAATATFLYSFSGGLERGATVNDIKLSSADISVPSAIVAEAVGQLRGKLFYLWEDDGKLVFKNQPNLNRILLTKMEGISDDNLEAEEKRILTSNLKKEQFDIFIWPRKTTDVPDTRKLKLVIQQSQDEEECQEFKDKCGERPRVYRNTVIFLCPVDAERTHFENFLKSKLAWQLIGSDSALSLSAEQTKEVKQKVKETEGGTREAARDLYRRILLPTKDGFKEIDLGMYTFGAELTIDREVYERLRSEGEILESLAPLSLKEKYLKDKAYVETKNIFESIFNTPGEIRITSEEVLKDCIREGVKQGLFGLGEIEDEKPHCRHFKADAFPMLVEKEVLIKAELCRVEKAITDEELQQHIVKIGQCGSESEISGIKEEISPYLTDEQKTKVDVAIEQRLKELEGERPTPKEAYKTLNLRLTVPSGRLSDVVRMVNYLKSKFDTVDVKIDISTRDGEITTSDYEDKIKEAIDQSSIRVEEEEVE